MRIDEIKNILKGQIENFVQREAKEATVFWLRDAALPAVKEVAQTYTAALQESSEKETGWCKFRDRVFLPCTVDGVLWLIGKALDGMAAKQRG